jgi:hypothetical protein
VQFSGLNRQSELIAELHGHRLAARGRSLQRSPGGQEGQKLEGQAVEPGSPRALTAILSRHFCQRASLPSTRKRGPSDWTISSGFTSSRKMVR